MTIAIPQDKYDNLTSLLLTWSTKKKCTKRDLLSLIGQLAFVCKIVRPGRTFLRRLIDLSTTVKQWHHHIDLNEEARLDIKCWVEFFPQVALFIIHSPSSTHIFSRLNTVYRRILKRVGRHLWQALDTTSQAWVV